MSVRFGSVPFGCSLFELDCVLCRSIECLFNFPRNFFFSLVNNGIECQPLASLNFAIIFLLFLFFAVFSSFFSSLVFQTNYDITEICNAPGSMRNDIQKLFVFLSFSSKTDSFENFLHISQSPATLGDLIVPGMDLFLKNLS